MKDSSSEKNSQKNDSKKNSSSNGETSEEGSTHSKQTYQNIPFSRKEHSASTFFPKVVPSRKHTFLGENINEMARSSFGDQERHSNNLEVKYAVEYIKKVKSYYPDDSITFSNFLEIMKDFKHGKTSTEDVAKVISILFKDKEVLISEFKKFLPQELTHMARYECKADDTPKTLETKLERMDREQAIEFVTLAKQRFSTDTETYAKFIKLLAFLKNKPVPEGKFRELEILLMDYPDLLAHLHKFIPDNAMFGEGDSTSFSMISSKLRSKGVYTEFIKCINAFNQGLISGKDLIFLLRPVIRDETLISELKRYIKYEEIELTNFTAKKLKLLKRIGSYRVLPEKYRINYEENGDILNRVCVGCPTHEREDEQYVFLKRNLYEENMFKVEDERFEIDLLLGRCDSLILSLEKASDRPLAPDGEHELSINDLEMSLGIVQELLEFIYGSNGEDVLEGILNKPREVISVVLNRLYLVNKAWRNERAKKTKVWNEEANKNHYKALDSVFCDFKHLNKKDLTYKVLSQSMLGTRKIDDPSVFEFIGELIGIYTEKCGTGNNLYATVGPLVDVFKRPEAVFYASPAIFPIVCYFLILYERIAYVKHIQLPKLVFSELAQRIGIKQHRNVDDRSGEILSMMRGFVSGEIEAQEYEEEVRILGGGHGYRLTNIDKILSKMDNKAAILKQDGYNHELLTEIYEDRSRLERVEIVEPSENYKFTIRNQEIAIEKIACGSYMQVLRHIERFKLLDFDENLVRNKVFLERNLTEFGGGRYAFNLEHRMCAKTMKLKYIAGTEDFFMRFRARARGA